MHNVICLSVSPCSLINSNPEALNRIKQLSTSQKIHFEQVDLRFKEELESVFKKYSSFDACIHFAGLKAVGESVSEPLKYYEHNIGGTVNLLQLLGKKCNIEKEQST